MTPKKKQVESPETLPEEEVLENSEDETQNELMEADDIEASEVELVDEEEPVVSLGGYELPNVDDQEISIVDQLKSIADPRRRMAERNVRLKWLVDDFEGITSSVYEAIMISAARARQVGRRQKLEIDAWNSSRQLDELDSDDLDLSEAGIDHFHHPKPTIQALFELKRRRIRFRYPDAEEQ